jgi:hypothetical protein
MFQKLKSRIRTFWQNRCGTHPGRPVRVDFYTRQSCCLCDEALKIIASVRSTYPLDLHLIDVDLAPGLEKTYGDRVPVVVVNGRERFHGHVNRVLLERLLSVESTQG